jgi:hypothetical protein
MVNIFPHEFVGFLRKNFMYKYVIDSIIKKEKEFVCAIWFSKFLVCD